MIIGIDPDLVKSGVGIVIDGKLTELKNLAFVDLIEFVVEKSKASDLIVHLENVEADKTTYPRKVSPAVMKKIAQDVGKVKAVCRLIHECLVKNGVRVKLIKPLKGYIKRAKGDGEFFNQLTGWTKRSNEDNRDAACLALFG